MAEHFMELLCPAGNMDKLKMAIRYGADASIARESASDFARGIRTSPMRN